jgi:dTDP-glucose pyrophosphorylase
VQPQPLGLCDALFRAAPFATTEDQVLIGLPDTIWFPENAYRAALDSQKAEISLVLFPVDQPQHFDAVVCDEWGSVQRVEVKRADAHSHWIWGAVTATGTGFHALKRLWEARHREDEYLGDLLNAYLAAGNAVSAVHVGEIYMDVGTLTGYHAAQDLLRRWTAAQAVPDAA